MSAIAIAVKHMLAAGLPSEAICAAVAEMEAAIAPARTKGAIRQERYRERHKASQVTQGDESDDQVSPDKESPHTPKKITSSPEFDSLCVREAVAVLAEIVDAIAEKHRSRWKGKPPPPGVDDEQWRGWLEHRRRHPKGGAFTERAYSLLCQKLAGFAECGWPPGDMIDLAIERGWITVFKPQGFANGQRKSDPQHEWGSTVAAANAVIAELSGAGSFGFDEGTPPARSTGRGG